MSDIQTWSTTAASNNSAAPNGFPEGMPPSGVNDAAREVMAAVARYREDTDGVNTSSGTDTITLASSRTMTAYAQGDMYTFKAGGTNTGATTLNVDGLGAKDVQFNGAACTGGEIITDLMYTVVYDGAQFQLMNAASYPAIDIETLEVTNIKAKDGTASMTIADSTGVVTAGTLNATTIDATNIEVTNIKAKDGTASIAIADTTGIPTFSQATIVSVTDNTNAALRVTQLGTGNALLIEDDTNPDSTPVAINASGNVFVGHTTAIDQAGPGLATITSRLQVPGTDQNKAAIGAMLFSTGTTVGPQLVLSKSANATVGSFTSSTANEVLGNIVFNGVDSSNTQFRNSAIIQSRCETVGADYASGSLRFITTDSSGTAGNVRLTVAGDGNIGIGENYTSPATLLDIAANNNGLTSDTANNTVRFTDTDTTTANNQAFGKIEFYTSDATNAGVAGYILGNARGASGGCTIRFAASENAGSTAEVFVIGPTGALITSNTARIGYASGAGSAVTQTTSRTTGVTIDAPCGAITLVSAAGSTTIQSFTVTNSAVAATDAIIVNQKSGTDLYRIYVTAVATGSFKISFATLSGTTTEQPVFNFAVIRAVAA